MATEPASSPARQRQSPYLVAYNSASFVAWAYVLAATITAFAAGGSAAVWARLGVTARYVETAAALEVMHAAAGLVRASPLTTALQVAGRNTIVWAICRNYPHVAAASPAYACMLVAWAAAEVVRYGYFAVDGLAAGPVPQWLAWCRYNMFLVLYPPGILSEAWLCYKVIEPSRARNPAYQYLLWAGLSAYVPASYILFKHMFAQRRKVAQRSAAAHTKKL